MSAIVRTSIRWYDEMVVDQLKVGFHGLFQIKEQTSANSRIIPLKLIDQKKERPVCSFTE